jgi:hypothetical protein
MMQPTWFANRGGQKGNPSQTGGKAGVSEQWPFHRGSVMEAPNQLIDDFSKNENQSQSL